MLNFSHSNFYSPTKPQGSSWELNFHLNEAEKKWIKVISRSIWKKLLKKAFKSVQCYSDKRRQFKVSSYLMWFQLNCWSFYIYLYFFFHQLDQLETSSNLKLKMMKIRRGKKKSKVIKINANLSLGGKTLSISISTQLLAHWV